MTLPNFALPVRTPRGTLESLQQATTRNNQTLENWLQSHVRRETRHKTDVEASFTNTVINTWEEATRVTFTFQDGTVADPEVFTDIEYDFAVVASAVVQNSTSATWVRPRMRIDYSTDGGSTWTSSLITTDGVDNNRVWGNLAMPYGVEGVTLTGDLVFRIMVRSNDTNLAWTRLYLSCTVTGSS